MIKLKHIPNWSKGYGKRARKYRFVKHSNQARILQVRMGVKGGKTW